jgi:isoquinoline 1-oxidoreductase beta subunit
MPFGSNICAITEVEVTPQGEVKLRCCVVAVDTGVVVNPNTIEAQVQGGLIFGWTGALYSELTYKDGTIQQGNFNDYRMMRIDQTPKIEVHIVASTEKPGGVGELATAIAAPTLNNAIFAASGVRLRKLPIDRSLLVQDKSANKVVMAGVGLGVGALATGAALAKARMSDGPPTVSASETEDAA